MAERSERIHIEALQERELFQVPNRDDIPTATIMEQCEDRVIFRDDRLGDTIVLEPQFNRFEVFKLFAAS